MKEFRAWANLLLTFLTVLIVPIGLLVLKNQRLEIIDEMRKQFVAVEVYHLNLSTIAAENASLKSEISLLSSKIERQTVTLARVVDAIKLRDAP